MPWTSKYKTVKPITPRWFIAAALLSALMLAIAHGFETFGGLAPCELCLHQREGYWAALAVAAVSYGLARWRYALAKPLLGLVAVEWKWWPGPAVCTGGAHAKVSAADMAALLNGTQKHIVQCDQAAWRMLGLSMAGWNALCALALSVATVVFALRLPVIRK
jgi:disulfide bond formation protein DsbB